MLAARRPDAPPAAVTLCCRSWPRLFRRICRRPALVVQPLEPACAAARGPLGQARAPPAVAARRRRRWPRRSPAAARPRLRGGAGAVRALLQRRRSKMETARLTSRIILPCPLLGSRPARISVATLCSSRLVSRPGCAAAGNAPPPPSVPISVPPCSGL